MYISYTVQSDHGNFTSRNTVLAKITTVFHKNVLKHKMRRTDEIWFSCCNRRNNLPSIFEVKKKICNDTIVTCGICEKTFSKPNIVEIKYYDLMDFLISLPDRIKRTMSIMKNVLKVLKH